MATACDSLCSQHTDQAQAFTDISTEIWPRKMAAYVVLIWKDGINVSLKFAELYCGAFFFLFTALTYYTIKLWRFTYIWIFQGSQTT